MVSVRYVIDALLYLHDYFDYMECLEEYKREPNVGNEVALSIVRASEIVSIDKYDGEHTQITCSDGWSNWKVVVYESYDEVVAEHNNYVKQKNEYERKGFEVFANVPED